MQVLLKRERGSFTISDARLMKVLAVASLARKLEEASEKNNRKQYKRILKMWKRQAERLSKFLFHPFEAMGVGQVSRG